MFLPSIAIADFQLWGDHQYPYLVDTKTGETWALSEKGWIPILSQCGAGKIDWNPNCKNPVDDRLFDDANKQMKKALEKK